MGRYYNPPSAILTCWGHCSMPAEFYVESLATLAWTHSTTRLKVEESGGSVVISGGFGFPSSKPGEYAPMRRIKLILVHCPCGY